MGLREDVREEPVSALPLRAPVLVASATSVRETVDQLKRSQLGCAFVVDRDQRPLGKFTERQLLRILADNPRGLDDPIDQHMMSVGTCVGLQSRIADVIDEMQKSGGRFVCVVDDDGRAVSLAGQRSVMEYIADHFPHQVKAQLMDSKLYMDQREGA